MNEKQRTRASKFLSLVLRHEPGRIGLTLDSAGWAEVDALLAAFQHHGHDLSRAELEEVVATNEKKRFAFSEDGQRIRASQGHSVEVELGYAWQMPPAALYHGTATRFVDSIRAQGLLKGARHHVHLSAQCDTAVRVGQRHGKPAVFIVRAAAMHAAGHTFFLSENGVWLTGHVPVEFLELQEEPFIGASSAGPGKRSTRAKMAEETIRIWETGRYTAAGGQEVEIQTVLNAAVADTCLHDMAGESAAAISSGQLPVRILVTNETTLSALQRLANESGEPPAALNFASAKNPGGGFLGGSEAQEESLARSSALYPCLLAAREYYERNRACHTALYLNLAIWSPAVPFFRDDLGRLLERPFTAGMITCPAPNAGAVATNEPSRLRQVEPTLRRRAEFVLRIAVAHGVRRLVLGAWGCGVFRNDPRMVAQVFAELVGAGGTFSRAFAEVVFAIYDRSPEQEVLRAFTEQFGEPDCR